MAYKRKIAVVTGSRAEYGILHPVMKRIMEHQKLRLQLIVTGMHLLPEFGYTIDDIKRDGFRVDAEVDMLLGGDTKASMVKSLGLGIISLTQVLEELRPDIVLVCGDRIEAFAAAVSAAHLAIPVAHLLGGDAAIGSNIDDSIRFSITHFAHIHFTAIQKHAERIIRLGEEPWRVHVTGTPALDTILQINFPSKEDVYDELGFALDKPLALVVQHPTTLRAEEAAREMTETMEAICELKLQSVIIYPNADAGGKAMINIINRFKETSPYIKAYRNLPREKYLTLMRVADVMIGNSSSGIIEAPSFHLPFVNIGPRQLGRERAQNVIDVGYNKNEIKKAIKKALYDKNFREQLKHIKNPYGDGKASERIVKILSEIKLNTKLLQKKFASVFSGE